MDNENFGRDQFIINNPTGKISIAESNAPREITVSGVGGTPPSFERYWVDRTSYQSLLTHRISTTPVTEIVAESGFGKSSLAAWGYANLKGDFKRRVWVSFGQPKTFDRVARWILQEIGFPNKDPQVNEETLLCELMIRLNDPNTPVKTLVILDQLESLADSSDRPWFEQFLLQWAEHGKESRVLVTTRSQILSQDSIALTGMDVGEGSEFLTREGLTGDRFSDLITLAKGHPLLLKLAASWTIETYESRVDDRAVDFFTKLFANYTGDPKAGVSAIFGVIFEALPSALQELLCRVSVYRLPIDGAMAEAMEGTREDLGILAGQGLLLLQGVDYVLHPLVAGLVRSRVTETVRRDGHERAIGFYEANYQPWDGTIESCREELEGFYHACELGEYDRASGILDRCYELLNRAGEWRSLLPLYERLTSEWNAVDDIEARNLGWGWGRLAYLNRVLGSYQSAINLYQQHNKIAQKIGDKQAVGASLGNLGHAYQSLGDYQKAVDFHSQSLEIGQEIGDKQGIASSLGGLGNAYQSLGNYQKAIEFHSQHNELAQPIGDKKGIAASLGNLGNAYDSLGDYQKAIDFHSQHNELAQAIGDKQGIANSLGGLGNAYQSLGDYQKAIDFHSQWNELAQAIGDKQGIANSLGSLGNAYDSLGDYQKAIDFHSQSMEIEQAIGDKQGIANSLGSLGNAYQSLGDYQKAIDFHSQSMGIKQAIGDKQGIANSLGNLGNAYQSLGDYQKAIDFYKKQYEITHEIGDKRGEANSMWCLNSAYQQRGRPKLSMHYRHQAYRIWQDMNLPLAAAPFPAWTKNLSQSMGDNWAEQLIASDKAMAWLMFPILYLFFALRILLSPLTQLQTRFKIQPKIFWFCVGIAIVLVIAWLKK
jgi:tetratricopeptide (TPR) repeat protein